MNMRTWHVMALAAVAMLLPAGVLKAQETVKIGVCNPAKVFESMDERKVIEDKMKSERDKATAEVNRRKQEVEDLQRQRNELRPESAIFQEKTNQMMEKAVQFEVWARLKEAEMGRTEKEQIKALYENEKADITQEVILRINKKYAAAGGIAPAASTGTGTVPQK